MKTPFTAGYARAVGERNEEATSKYSSRFSPLAAYRRRRISDTLVISVTIVERKREGERRDKVVAPVLRRVASRRGKDDARRGATRLEKPEYRGRMKRFIKLG